MAYKQRTLTLMMMAWLSKAWLSATVMGRLCSTPSHLCTHAPRSCERRVRYMHVEQYASLISCLCVGHLKLDKRHCMKIRERWLCKQKELIIGLSKVMQTVSRAQKLGTATALLIRQARGSA